MDAIAAVDLSTRYLGLDLPHPLMPGASPLVDDLDVVRQLEDAGAAAIVMHSLFEEQIEDEQIATHLELERAAESYGEALSYLPDSRELGLGPDEYLEQLRRIKQAVDVPVIASLNGTTPGGWLQYAELLEEAGADALELNVYDLVTDPWETGSKIEGRTLEMVRTVKSRLGIPIAVKLSPFYTSLVNFVQELADAGADGVVLFNRFYQPDLDVDELDVGHTLLLSTSEELRLRLRWIAILTGQVRASLAVTGGVQTARDVVKAVMSGAHAVQVVSSLFRHGTDHLATLREGLALWMEENGYQSLEELRGVMSLERCPDPHAYERANYMRVLRGWWRSYVAGE